MRAGMPTAMPMGLSTCHMSAVPQLYISSIPDSLDIWWLLRRQAEMVDAVEPACAWTHGQTWVQKYLWAYE